MTVSVMSKSSMYGINCTQHSTFTRKVQMYRAYDDKLKINRHNDGVVPFNSFEQTSAAQCCRRDEIDLFGFIGALFGGFVIVRNIRAHHVLIHTIEMRFSLTSFDHANTHFNHFHRRKLAWKEREREKTALHWLLLI